MDLNELERRILALPEGARREIEALVSQLERVYAESRSSSDASPEGIRQHPFAGLWANRTDMTDSVEWVRSVRERQWGISDE